jgi:hypothetical protein
MATPRATVSFFLFVLVSAVAVTAFATDPPKGNLLECFKKCETQILVCASDTDVKKLCASIPECAGLSDSDAKAANNFCDACRKSGDDKECTKSPDQAKGSDPKADPKVAPAAAAAGKNPKKPSKPQVKSATLAKPLTKEDLCKKQGGILRDGTCYTRAAIVKEIAALKTALENLKGGKLSDSELAAIKARLDALEKTNLPDAFRDYVQKLLKEQSDWVRSKLESLDYKIDQQSVVNLTQGRRLDLLDRRLAGVVSTVDRIAPNNGRSPGIVGVHLGLVADVHSLQPYGVTRFFVGAEGELAFKVVSPIYVMIGAGGGYAGEDLGLSLKTLRFRLGVTGVHPKVPWFHISGGGVFDRTFDNIEHDLSSAYSLFVRPELCVPNRATACLGITGSVGYMDYPIRNSDRRYGEFSASIGLAISFAYMPY